MSQKYITTSENLRKTIEKYGIAIIENVIDENECDAMAKGIYDYFEHITKNMDVPFDHTDQNTWRTFYDLYPLNSMLMQLWSVGHAQVSWDLRQNPKIVAIFANFWGVKPEDLLVSFDGLSFHLPPEITNKGWFNGHKLHVDQSYTKHGFHTLQSWITAKDIDKNDATLMCLEKSHKLHKAFGKKYGITDKKDWYKLSEEELLFYKDCKEVFIRCKKGSLITWDSRIIHCGSEAAKGRKEPKERMVIYLCYSPRIEDDNTKKKEAFETLRTTSHNPVNIKMFPTKPRTYGKTLPNINPINPPVLTPLGQRLAGY